MEGTLVRRTAAALVAALLATGCGGGGSSPASSTPPSSGGGDPVKLVVLDAGNFDGLVLAAPRPSLVKFQSPT
jgi:ABC-type glycerol-3-phosphate transport system substrate-binding protein